MLGAPPSGTALPTSASDLSRRVAGAVLLTFGMMTWGGINFWVGPRFLSSSAKSSVAVAPPPRIVESPPRPSIPAMTAASASANAVPSAAVSARASSQLAAATPSSSVTAASSEAANALTPFTVLFATNSYALTSDAAGALANVAARSRARPDLRIRLEGHADRRGREPDNQGLSARRVEVTRSYLVSLGVDPTRIATRAFGASQPIDPEDTPNARQRNRSVVIIWW